MHARLCGSKSSLNLYQIINKTDFPSLADEIAEPRQDMNIKVAAFTVSEKSSNTHVVLHFTYHIKTAWLVTGGGGGGGRCQNAQKHFIIKTS